MGSTWCSRIYMNFRMLKCLIKLIDKIIWLWKIDKVRKFFPIYPYWQYEKKHVDSQYDKLILYLSKNGQYSVKIDGGIILDVMINYCIILHVHVQFIGVSNSDKKNGIEYMHTTDTLTRLDTTKQNKTEQCNHEESSEVSKSWTKWGPETLQCLQQNH